MAHRNRRVAALFISLWLVLCLPTLAAASPPDLLGLWKGTAPKITPQGCANEAVTLNITHQCGNLISGSMSFSGAIEDIVGRISGDVNIAIHGFDAMGTVVSITAAGQYVATPTPQIILDISYFYDSANYNNVEYDVCTLTK